MNDSLDDAIHALAQPLTVLSFVLDLALLQDDPNAWKQALNTGRQECARAIRALEGVRTVARDDAAETRSDFNDLARSSW